MMRSSKLRQPSIAVMMVAVLCMALVACGDDDAGPEGPGNLTEVAAEAGDFNLLIATLQAAGLADTIATGGPFTVFAPNDAAINATLTDMGITVEDLVSDVEMLTAILTYHVVQGEVLAEAVVGMTSATTLQGSDIAIEAVDDGVVLNGKVNVTATDVMASNGVIHIIDYVLMPPMGPKPMEIPETYNFGVAGCDMGPSDDACDCAVAKADCVSADGGEYPMWTDECASSCSSIKYTGQSMRQALISDLNDYVGKLTGLVDGSDFEPTTAQDTIDMLDFYFRFDAESDGDTLLDPAIFLTKTANPTTALKEATYNDISTSNLVKKLAGNDAKTDHQCWAINADNPNCDGATETHFSGWGDVATPEELIVAWFTMLGDNAVKRANGEIDWDIHLTPEGHDLQQLIQKFLSVAITFSQGADDYLDDDMDGKGLKSSNEPEDGQPYTDLAHAWDEGFGYFGAARDYAAYTDDEIAGKGGQDGFLAYHDTDEDGFISLKSEYNFGASQNAAKRDRGSAEDAKTDFTKDVFDAFLAGRTLIHNNPGALSDELMTELMGYRDTIVWGWEKAYAATVVHYINDTLQDMGLIGTDDYSFTDHARHWGEMKGFALAFQFSPHSPLSDDDFRAFHDLVGTAPVLTGDDELAAYKTALLDARALLQSAYGFADANMGDDDGLNGW